MNVVLLIKKTYSKSSQTSTTVTPCLSAPVKIWSVKAPPPSEKSLNFLPNQSILHSYVNPGGNAEYLLFPSDFLNLTPNVLILSQWVIL